MMWPLSCYGKGDERCLLGGDTSFEELRWVVGAVALARGDANAVHARAREFARGKEDDVNAILGFPPRQARPARWSPYNRVRAVNADS
tara:strand:- start:43 stop:306 length:264 start_codon:yes stop_codon:yes gene_type:complete